MTPSTSLPDMIVSTSPSCPGRNESYPKYRLSAANARAAAPPVPFMTSALPEMSALPTASTWPVVPAISASPVIPPKSSRAPLTTVDIYRYCAANAGADVRSTTSPNPWARIQSSLKIFDM